MNWFYAAEGQQKGPISEMDFTMLAREGVIHGETLVWREGLPDWQPLSNVRPDLIPLTAGAPVIGSMAVSEQNKDLVVQQMREGALPASMGTIGVAGIRYAGFWIRVAAAIIDYILVQTVFVIAYLAVFGTTAFTISMNQMGDPASGTVITTSQIIMSLLQLIVYVFYHAFMVTRWGGTLGKLAVGIRVVREDMVTVPFGRAIGRIFASLLNYFTCGLTYLMVAFDEPEKRALHDFICGTRVIYK